MRYISIEEVEKLHQRVIQQSGGASGLRDRGSLESSVLQPLQSFGDHDFYPSVVEKAAALGYFLIQNHPFLDGNKRIGHAALEAVLMLNGYQLSGSVDEHEEVVLAVARGESSREHHGVGTEARCSRRLTPRCTGRGPLLAASERALFFQACGSVPASVRSVGG